MLDQVSALEAGPVGRPGPAVAVRGLSKRFGDRVAFQDLSFEIGRGEVFGFRRAASVATHCLPGLRGLRRHRRGQGRAECCRIGHVIEPTPELAIGCGALLIVLDVFGWRLVSGLFDRERLISGGH